MVSQMFRNDGLSGDTTCNTAELPTTNKGKWSCRPSVRAKSNFWSGRQLESNPPFAATSLPHLISKMAPPENSAAPTREICQNSAQIREGTQLPSGSRIGDRNERKRKIQKRGGSRQDFEKRVKRRILVQGKRRRHKYRSNAETNFAVIIRTCQRESESEKGVLLKIQSRRFQDGDSNLIYRSTTRDSAAKILRYAGDKIYRCRKKRFRKAPRARTRKPHGETTCDVRPPLLNSQWFEQCLAFQ